MIDKKDDVHVFYNKKKKDGTSAYLTGTFYSKKNKTRITYRSSYELKFFQMLEAEDNVVAYQSETVAIPYKNSEGKRKQYVPDIIATFQNGDMYIYEIKPKAMLANTDVRLKARACVAFFKDILKGSGLKATYRFITEEHLFSSPKEYSDFVKNHQNGRY